MKRRLRMELLTLQLIEKRRMEWSNAAIGREAERRIIDRHLRELEALASAERLPAGLSEA